MNKKQLPQSELSKMAETMYCHYDQLLQQANNQNLPAFAIEIYTKRQQFWAAMHASIVPLETVCPFVKSLNNYS